MATTDSRGRYYFASLPRGRYILNVEIAGYLGVEKQGIELAVGTRLENDFALSPRAGQNQSAAGRMFDIIPPAPSLPVETTASSVSVVVDENRIKLLPLANRNIYSLFLLQPGVTSQGAVDSRGLTFSVHGQRVSGSNYQLDGVDNNNIVLTGPVAAASAEAIQEFRMVNSSFSAENGRATAFVAQVVTRSGTNRFHGSVFEYLGNDKLDANTYENNSKGIPKPAFRQNQFGYSLGGRIRKNSTFFWSGLELSRLRFRTPEEFRLPTPSFIASLPQNSEARRLLTEIPPLPTTPTAENPDVGVIQYGIPNRIDTALVSERLDHNFANAKDRLMARYTLSSTARELGDEFNGYPSLMPTDHFRGQNVMIGWTHSFESGYVNDLRIGWSQERIDLPRPRSDVPILVSFDDVKLPGNTRESQSHENNNVVQISDTFSLQKGRAAFTMGFDFHRNISNSQTLGLQSAALGGQGQFPNGLYAFPSLSAFGQDQPFSFFIDVDPFSSGNLRLPDLQRQYRSNDYAAFVQADLRLTARFSLSLGLRYEYYGVLHNTDRSQDVNFYFGQGATIEDRLANGVLRTTVQNSGDLQGLLYRPDRNNFAPSIGIAWDPFGRGQTVFRAGYSIAYDRVFDTARDVRSNHLQLVPCFPSPEMFCVPVFLVPAELMLPQLDQNLGPPSVMQLDENLRTPYAQNWYVGVQHTFTPNLLLEIGHAGSVGRKLISRDLINRSIGLGPRINPQIGDDTFLSNQGNSNYMALEVSLRRRFDKGLAYQVSYTWSHAIDNQSDIFEGIRIDPRDQKFALTTFTRQFDPRADRGNANFDQRQNLVMNAIWQIPKPGWDKTWAKTILGGWTVSLIGAFRSGFPVTVISSVTPNSTTGLANNRLDFVGEPGQPLNSSSPTPVPGGVQWLDPTLFQLAGDHVGNVGRGAIKGPGFWNYDFALLRDISLREGWRLQFRSEFYNVFNHANLSAPVTNYLLPSGAVNPDFGKSYYGLNRTFSRFGDLALENPSRRIQLALRLDF